METGVALVDADVRRLRRELERELATIERQIRQALDRAHLDDDGGLKSDAFNLQLARKLGGEIAEQLDKYGSSQAKAFRGTVAELVRRIGRALDRAGVGAQFATMSDRSLVSQAGSELDALVKASQSKLKRAGADVEKRLRPVVLQMLRTGVNPDRAVERLAKAVGASVGQTVALVDVSLAGVDRAATLGLAQDVGVEWFAYVGPVDSLTRPDCRRWVNKRFTRAQMASLRSDVGPQPPALHGGGYGCRHTWEPLLEAEDVALYPRWRG